MRILVLIAIGLLLYVIVSNLLRRNRPLSPPKSQRMENMVQCHHCGLHILEQEAIRDGTHFYCSREHQQAEK